MTRFTTIVAGIALATASLGALAQVTPRVDARQARQETRIDAGVASGQLNARETTRLDHQQGRVAAAEADVKSDGNVTGAERRHLKRMQDRASANIHKQKHDAQVDRP